MVSRKAVRRPVAPGELPEFDPVPRQCARHDGWTPERQRWFIAALADTGCVAIAARMVNMSPVSAYQLRRQPGAESFRRAWDAAQTLGLQPVRDEAFERAMVGQLVPVFVGGKLMGFRRKKNDRLLMFILRHYGQDAQGRKTTVNYFSTRASAGAASQSSLSRSDGEGDRVQRGGGATADPSAVASAKAEASTTTLKTVTTGPAAALSGVARDDAAASIVNAFEGVDLDAEARAEIYRTLEACAERRRALEEDPENDPQCLFAYPSQARGGAYLGELELGADPDWVEYKPEGEHSWESLGEGGSAAEVDRVLAEMQARLAARTPEQIAADEAEHETQLARLRAERDRPALPLAREPDPDDPRLDWRNWTDEGYVPPSCEPVHPEPEPTAAHPEALLSEVEGPEPVPAEAGKGPISPRTGKHVLSPSKRPMRPYKQRTPKPPFAPPDKAREAEARVEAEALRRAGAAAEAVRRKARARRG